MAQRKYIDIIIQEKKNRARTGENNRAYIHAYIHTYIHTHTYHLIHTYWYMHTNDLMHTYIHTYTHMISYIHTCMHTNDLMHAYIHTHIWSHTYMIHTYTHMIPYIHTYDPIGLSSSLYRLGCDGMHGMVWQSYCDVRSFPHNCMPHYCCELPEYVHSIIYNQPFLNRS